MNKIRVYLRALEIQDYVKIHEWRKDNEIVRYFGGVPLFSSSENEKKWVESRIFEKENVSCAICLKDSDEFIGVIFLNNIDHHNRSASNPLFIGDKKHRGKGYAVDAKILMLKYAFIDRGLERIADKVLEDNIVSIKLHEKVGYKKEGLSRKSNFKNGKFLNAYYMAVIKEDFLEILKYYEI
jgi:RimJ/RimL family protein N-acetyltransferase